MSIYNRLSVDFKCNTCNIVSDFEEELDISGMRQEKCKDFDIKFIKNIENYEVEYSFSINCNKCKTNEIILNEFRKDDSSQENIYKNYQCHKCKKEISIQIILMSDDNEDKPKEISKSKKDDNLNENDNIIFNKNIQFNN